MPREENRAWTPRKDHMHAYIVSQALPYMKHILNYPIRTTGITCNLHMFSTRSSLATTKNYVEY